ncbi:S16 family serine protease [endosymbiont of Riftia pachyptila]|uniref:S16 family serine protease n=1 Tax=endosymbiont of Riftia pachyptila TaxID=54396 RepID=UPI001111E8D5
MGWGEVGGELLLLEVAVVRGRGRLRLTGWLVEVVDVLLGVGLLVFGLLAISLGVLGRFYRYCYLPVSVSEWAWLPAGSFGFLSLLAFFVCGFPGLSVWAGFGLCCAVSLLGGLLPVCGLAASLLGGLGGCFVRVVLRCGSGWDLV